MVDLAKCPNDVPLPDYNCLADYRNAVERLRGETIEELGRQPLPPETAAMLAVLGASAPIIAALHPSIPVQLYVWQVAAILVAVWSGVFWIQRRRYDRFQAAWSRKVDEHAADPAVVPIDVGVFRHCGRSGQTIGVWAAENRRVSVAPSSSIARIIWSRPARTTSPRIDLPSSSQTSAAPSIQRQGASL
jgi:hypothetical protein